ncbi:hypothetical protein QE152_g27296 [Popillia japonica]|uniref:Uncharacterized protein n=1 Tax=Popillia japonica TaxID=7064 RepID=A0AAW1JTG1_POPJA
MLENSEVQNDAMHIGVFQQNTWPKVEFLESVIIDNAIMYQKDTGTEQLAPINALSMFVEAGLSRKQYEVIRSFNKKFYPCYSIIQNEKKKCYPKQESYQVTASCAEVNLQHLLDHTVTRLLKYLEEVIRTLNQDDRKKLILISKWGCDGSQQVQFKQKYDNEDVTNEEISYIENQIATLKVTEGIQENYSFSVEHKMTLTMVDGKVCNAATSTKSTMKCYICGATSKDFNNLQLNKEINPLLLAPNQL